MANKPLDCQLYLTAFHTITWNLLPFLLQVQVVCGWHLRSPILTTIGKQTTIQIQTMRLYWGTLLCNLRLSERQEQRFDIVMQQLYTAFK